MQQQHQISIRMQLKENWILANRYNNIHIEAET